MAVYELRIILNDDFADEDTNAVDSAVSNLEYDGYTIQDVSITKVGE